MRNSICVLAIITALHISGCAVVPPESVKLSSIVGQDIGELSKNHLAYVDAYYDRIEAQLNRAIDQIYAPDLISAALRGQSGELLFKRLEAGKAGGDTANDAVVFASRFLTNVRNKVEGQRAADLKPIRDARKVARAELEAAYAQVVRGNATITAYLASVAKVKEAQDDLFKIVGLQGLPDKTAATLAGFSDQVDSLVNDAKEKDAKFDELQRRLREAVDKLRDK